MPQATAFEQALGALAPSVIEETIRVTEIPAPTFREGTRAEYARARFEEIGGWEDVTVDSISNVVAVRKGAPDRARLLVVAHLDTVFPDEATPVTRSRGRLTGRGVGDNSLGVAALLGVAQAVQKHAPKGLGDLILATNVGEEGRGDLRGVKRLLKDYQGQFDAVIAVEGHALNRIQLHGVASLRHEISVATDGGHSWGAYGRPNAIALLARAITAIEPLMPEVGVEPRTTMNVGVIHGGRSVNTIAPDATLELDIRSVDPQRVTSLLRSVRAAMRDAVGEEGEMAFRRIGNRPGGTIEEDHPLVQAAVQARSGLDLPAPEFNAGSTDANAALDLGYPATCVGVTTGGEPHTPREWISTGPIAQGVPYLGRTIVNAARLSRSDVARLG
ncbi:MAG: M20/M25/M40 family metallo-hydrolase [Dehalococcoidia bacterium]|nr:M20/M25/M40 family metallo-hydrolase [Dehalococcoidia bacterium]MCA9856018.1 M20/M25/M40 family metallo-hydrolase [Dehalococcoidia bacterium]